MINLWFWLRHLVGPPLKTSRNCSAWLCICLCGPTN